MPDTCIFPACKRHPMQNGLCIGHSKHDTSIPKKKYAGIPKKSAKKLAEEKNKPATTDLQAWYDNIMKTEKAVCWETGEKIDKKDKKGWHGSIAHILPKKTFRSVATHPKNYLILKMWGGTHARYDVSWQSASKMKVWPTAVQRFLEIYPHIADSEKKYLPDVLLKELEKYPTT